MALRTVIQEGDPVLRKKARDVVSFDERLGILLDDMRETMRFENGVGLAAPQVGILRRAVVIEYEDRYLELINPAITSSEGEEIAYEGCLSIDSKKNCPVKRPTKLTYTAQDRFGNPITATEEGWLARIICHELDHLDGILFIDKAYKGEK